MKFGLSLILLFQISLPVQMAAVLGFEPRQTESESAVLPLHNTALFFATKILYTNSFNLSIVNILNIIYFFFGFLNIFLENEYIQQL